MLTDEAVARHPTSLPEADAVVRRRGTASVVIRFAFEEIVPTGTLMEVNDEARGASMAEKAAGRNEQQHQREEQQHTGLQQQQQREGQPHTGPQQQREDQHSNHSSDSEDFNNLDNLSTAMGSEDEASISSKDRSMKRHTPP